MIRSDTEMSWSYSYIISVVEMLGWLCVPLAAWWPRGGGARSGRRKGYSGVPARGGWAEPTCDMCWQAWNEKVNGVDTRPAPLARGAGVPTQEYPRMLRNIRYIRGNNAASSKWRTNYTADRIINIKVAEMSAHDYTKWILSLFLNCVFETKVFF